MLCSFKSEKWCIDLWIVSVLFGGYYSLTSSGSLCEMLLGGSNFSQRIVLAILLGTVLWGMVTTICVVMDRLQNSFLLRNMISSLLDEKIVVFFYILIVSRLIQAVFYPYHAEEKIFFVSKFLLAAFLTVVVLSYVAGHRKMLTAVVSSTILGAIGWCVGRVLFRWDILYDGFFYCLLLVNGYAVLRITQNVRIWNSILKTKNWVQHNKVYLAAGILMACVCGCTEFICNIWSGTQVLLPRVAFGAAVGFCLTGCAFFYRKKEHFVERSFLCIILTVGIYMAVFMPLSTLVSWDDEIHYANAISIVQGNNVNYADWTMESRDTDWFRAYIERSNMMGKISASSTSKFITELSHRAEFLSEGAWLGADIQFYQRIGYIPNAIGLCIGQTINLSYGITFILGRVSGVICYALIMYAAMKRLSSGKLLVATVALIPTNVFQAANYTYDAWIVCFVVLAISIFISYLQNEDKQIYAKDMLMPLMILVLAIAPKGIYFPLFLLFVLIPSAKFVDNNQYKTYVKNVFGAMIVCFIMYMLLPFLGGKNQGDLRFGTEVSAVGQIIHILKNPVIYIRNLFGFLKGYLSLENSFDYTCFWAYLTFNRVDYHATMMVLLFVTAVIDHGSCDNAYCTGMVKLTTTALIYVIAAMIATVLYLTCSPVGADVINGCQPRYLAPLVFPFLMLVCNLGAFQLKHKCAMQAVILTISGYVLFVLAWSNIAGQYIV